MVFSGWKAIHDRVDNLVALGLTPWGVVRILDWVILAVIKERGE